MPKYYYVQMLFCTAGDTIPVRIDDEAPERVTIGFRVQRRSFLSDLLTVTSDFTSAIQA